MSNDLLIARLAEANDGIVGRAAAKAAGCTERSLDRRIAAGLLLPVHPGVYRLAGHADSFQGRVRAAALWAGEDALITGGTALTLHGVEGVSGNPIHLCGPVGKRQPGVLIKRVDTTALKRRSVSGMWTTTIERALLDACSLHSASDVGRAMDDALRQRRTSIPGLRSELPERSQGVNGSARYRQLVRLRDFDDASVRSELETRMLKILRRIKACRFIPNYELKIDGRRYVLDFAVPELRLGIECHSRRWHGTERVTSDAARDRAMKREDWTLLYFTWDEVTFTPDRAQTEIEAFLATLF